MRVVSAPVIVTLEQTGGFGENEGVCLRPRRRVTMEKYRRSGHCISFRPDPGVEDSMRFVLGGVPIVLASLCLLPASGEESPRDGKDADAEIRRLTAEIQVLYLLNRLDPSEAQMQALLPIAAEARELHLAYEKDQAACLVEMEKAFLALKAEDEAERGLSKEVTSAAIRANETTKDLEKNFHLRLAALATKAGAILSGEQAAAAKAFKPPVIGDGKIPQEDLRGKPRKAEDSREAKLLREIRDASEGGLDRIEGELVALQLGREEARRGEPFSEKARKSREAEVRLLFRKARSLSEEEFEDALEDLAREIRPRTRLEELSWAMENLAKGRRPGSGTIETILLSPHTAPILEKRMGKKKE
jgi:hypothetical protein